MSYSNYRNNTPHYNSMPFSNDPMNYAQGMNMGSVPGMPPYGNSMYMQNYFPSMPFMTGNNSPTMPRMPNMPSMPNMPGMPSMPSMPSMPTAPGPGMAPFIPESEMDNLPDGDMPALPRGSDMRMPEFNQPGNLPAMPQMPGDGNMYPGVTMPGSNMPMEMTCEQLIELTRNMECLEEMHEFLHNMNGDHTTMPETPAAPTTPTMPTTPRTPTTPTMPTTPRTPTTPTMPSTPTAPAAPGTHNNHGISRFYR